MPKNVPTADQIRAYLLANGWQMGESGRAAYLMVRMGHTIRMLHEPTEYDLDKAAFDISLAEGRHPADVRKDVLACAVAAAPDAPAVGDVIATLTACRIALGLSQRRVGFLSGLGTSVCEYEAGRARADAAEADRVGGLGRLRRHGDAAVEDGAASNPVASNERQQHTA